MVPKIFSYFSMIYKIFIFQGKTQRTIIKKKINAWVGGWVSGGITKLMHFFVSIVKLVHWWLGGRVKKYLKSLLFILFIPLRVMSFVGIFIANLMRSTISFAKFL